MKSIISKSFIGRATGRAKIGFAGTVQEKISECNASFPVGVMIQVTIEEYIPDEAGQLRKYYWKHIVGVIAKEEDATPTEVHKFLKDSFNKGKSVFGSKSKLEPFEQENFLKDARGWAKSFLNITIMPKSRPEN